MLARLVRPFVTHWQFSLVVAAAVAVRIVVVLGYPPILWFSDSYNYLYDAVTHIPDQVRPNGYPFLLDLLLPLHSDTAIGLLQAAMGVVVGVAIYEGCPGGARRCLRCRCCSTPTNYTWST